MTNAQEIAERLLKSDQLDIKLNVPMPIIATVYDGPSVQAVLTSVIAPHLIDADRKENNMARFDRDDYTGKPLEEIIGNPDEPVFVIRGQDAVSGPAVRAWADLAEMAGADPDIVQSAREHSYRMDRWRPKSMPDLPGGN